MGLGLLEGAGFGVYGPATKVFRGFWGLRVQGLLVALSLGGAGMGGAGLRINSRLRGKCRGLN